MNRNCSLSHSRFLFSSFLLSALVREGKNARNGQAQEKSRSCFAGADLGLRLNCHQHITGRPGLGAERSQVE